MVHGHSLSISSLFTAPGIHPPQILKGQTHQFLWAGFSPWVPPASKVLGELQSCQLLSDCCHGWKDASCAGVLNLQFIDSSAGPSLAGKHKEQHSLGGAVNTPGTVWEGSAAVWGPAPWNRTCLSSLCPDRHCSVGMKCCPLTQGILNNKQIQFRSGTQFLSYYWFIRLFVRRTSL